MFTISYCIGTTTFLFSKRMKFFAAIMNDLTGNKTFRNSFMGPFYYSKWCKKTPHPMRSYSLFKFPGYYAVGCFGPCSNYPVISGYTVISGYGYFKPGMAKYNRHPCCYSNFRIGAKVIAAVPYPQVKIFRGCLIIKFIFIIPAFPVCSKCRSNSIL